MLISLPVLPRLMLCRPFSTMRYPPHNLGETLRHGVSVSCSSAASVLGADRFYQAQSCRALLPADIYLVSIPVCFIRQRNTDLSAAQRTFIVPFLIPAGNELATSFVRPTLFRSCPEKVLTSDLCTVVGLGGSIRSGDSGMCPSPTRICSRSDVSSHSSKYACCVDYRIPLSVELRIPVRSRVMA